MAPCDAISSSVLWMLAERLLQPDCFMPVSSFCSSNRCNKVLCSRNEAFSSRGCAGCLWTAALYDLQEAAHKDYQSFPVHCFAQVQFKKAFPLVKPCLVHELWQICLLKPFSPAMSKGGLSVRFYPPHSWPKQWIEGQGYFPKGTKGPGCVLWSVKASGIVFILLED